MSEKKSDFNDYVCSNCFYTLDKCSCEFDPRTLINIDKGIQYAVRGLIYKGYLTISSCESHFKSSLSVHVQFRQGYQFDNLPEGFKWHKKSNSVEHIISRKNFDNEEGFNKEKNEAIEALNRWVDSLPPESHLRDVPRENR